MNLKILSAIGILVEIYRVFMGSVFVVFAPAVCGDHRCTWFENYQRGNTLYHVTFIINMSTLAVFIMMYYIELKRENKLSKYMRINYELASDTKTIETAMELLTDERHVKLRKIHVLYNYVAYITLSFFLVNTILSGYVIVVYFLDDKSGTAFITNTLFIGSKLYDIWQAIRADKNVYLSAYNKTKLQFNDIRPEKRKVLEVV